MSKLMILGAGISQVPLIQKAKDMGLYVIVLSWKGNYPGIELADRYYEVDTTNMARVLEIAQLERIDGICTTGTDVAIQSIGKVNDTLGLPGVSAHSALLATNKLLMKEAFMTHDVRVADYYKVRNKKEAWKAFKQLMPLGSAVIFKAVDCGASKGIVKVSEPTQFEKAYDAVMAETKQNFFIVESFISGIEFGAQAFIVDREIKFVLPHGDLVYHGDTGVPIGHHVPYVMNNVVKQDMYDQLMKSIKATQLDNCAINADFILKDDQVYVLEIGARAGATCLPELVSTYYNIDYYEQMIRLALGWEMGTLHSKVLDRLQGEACVCELMISDASGQIVSQLNHNAPHPNIISIAFDYSVGDRVRKFNVGTDRIGQIIVKGEHLNEAFALMDEVKRNIEIKVE